MPDPDRIRLITSDGNEEGEESHVGEIRSRRSTSDGVFGDGSAGDQGVDVGDINAVLQDVLNEQIVAVFVAAFHTRSGNMIEWSMPLEIDLTGVEFKTIVSGCHVLNQDFVYFRKGRYFGLACYKQLRVEDTDERGARMKAVGIMASSYTSLHRYMKRLFELTDQMLQTPGTYDEIVNFFEQNKVSLPHSSEINSGSRYRKPDSIPKLVITHPAGCFAQMIAFFEEQVLCLWKCSLLKKRIIFFSPPPIGVVCYRVYCCCCMAENSIWEYKMMKPQPFFYVNVADIDVLKDAGNFIACTTEKIFESKKQLYDVFIDNQNIIVNTEDKEVKKLSEVSEFDQNRYEHLNNLRMSHVYQNYAEESTEEEEFISFFREQNDRIFNVLRDTATLSEPVVTEEHAKAMGLDPVKDRIFLEQLITVYDIPVTLRLETPCCP